MNNFVITHLDSFYSDELNTVHHSSELNTVQLVSSELNRAQLDLTQLSLKKHQDLPIRIRRRHQKKTPFCPDRRRALCYSLPDRYGAMLCQALCYFKNEALQVATHSILVGI